MDALVKASPEVLFLAFGRRSLFSSATMWQSILYPPIFVRLIDLSLCFLFKWTAKNINLSQKLAAYPHLYSFTSTKSVVHWFQIIRNKSFQMYDDDVQAPLSLGASDRYYKVAKFPTRNIKTPIVLVYGGSDSLVDIKVMLKELPRHTVAKEIPHYEHLDFLWGQEVESLVFPHVYQALVAYSGRDHRVATGFENNTIRNGRLAIADSSGYSDDDLSSSISDINPGVSPASPKINFAARKSSGNRSSFSTPYGRKHMSPPSSSSTERTSLSLDGHTDAATAAKSNRTRSKLGRNAENAKPRSGSISSTTSLDTHTTFGTKGISLGAGKATTGISGGSPSLRASERSSKT